MKKEILSEINRNREIMGLSLITEAYEVRAEGTIKDSAEYINKYLTKKGFKGGLKSIPGYNQLQTLMQSAIFRTYPLGGGSEGRKLEPHNVIQAIVQHMGGGNVKKGIKLLVRAIKEQGQKLFVDQKTLPVNLSGAQIATHGNVMQNKVDTDGRRAMNNRTVPSTLVTYLNGFNMSAYANDGEIYDVETMDDGGFLNFMQGPNDPGGILIVYSLSKGMKQTAETETDTDVEKGYKATGKYDTDYKAGDSTPDSKLVAKAVNEIAQMFPADVEIDVFNLQAGASANWGEDEIFEKSEGKGDTGYAEGNEGKNQKLAFDRGNNFMMAVNKGLKAKGHPGFDNYVVNWKVEGQNQSDQFIDLMLNVDKKDKIKTIIIKTSIEGDKVVKSGKSNLFGFLIGLE